jgi:hypothetical protein
MNSRSLLLFMGLNKSETFFKKTAHSVGPDPARGAAACHAQWPDSHVGLGLATQSSKNTAATGDGARERQARSRRGHRAHDCMVARSPTA